MIVPQTSHQSFWRHAGALGVGGQFRAIAGEVFGDRQWKSGPELRQAEVFAHGRRRYRPCRSRSRSSAAPGQQVRMGKIEPNTRGPGTGWSDKSLTNRQFSGPPKRTPHGTRLPE